jgi:streptogramin lyase
MRRQPGRRNGTAWRVSLAIAAWLGGWSAAAAQAITEYPIPTATGDPMGIAQGPDGNLWFVEYFGGQIGRITTSGTVSEFAIPTKPSNPTAITTGPDGALWFTETFGNAIGRITTSGTITEFPLPVSQGLTRAPGGITLGPDGNLWFTELNAGRIGNITTAGVITEFPLQIAGLNGPITTGPDNNLWFTFSGGVGRFTTSGQLTTFALSNLSPGAITNGPDGALWFVENLGLLPTSSANMIGRITTSGTISQFAVPTGNNTLEGIATGPDGALWFTEAGTAEISSFGNSIDKIARITTAGVITEFPTPTPGALVQGITAGPDGNLWFAEGAGQIGTIVPTSLPPSPLVAAVLPQSRSIAVGGTANAFATIINSSTSGATDCGIAQVTKLPVTFHYQTTNPTTNALTGTPDTPVAIAASASQTYVVGLTANSAFAGTETAFAFGCSGGLPAPVFAAVDTLILTASTTPQPDIVALGATPSGDGIVTLSGVSGSGAFAVAAVNVARAARSQPSR